MNDTEYRKRIAQLRVESSSMSDLKSSLFSLNASCDALIQAATQMKIGAVNATGKMPVQDNEGADKYGLAADLVAGVCEGLPQLVRTTDRAIKICLRLDRKSKAWREENVLCRNKPNPDELADLSRATRKSEGEQ